MTVSPYPLMVAGFMSGTSLDGVDVAVIKTDGLRIFDDRESFTYSYPLSFQKRLKAILGQQHITQEVRDITRELMDYHIKAYEKLSHTKAIDIIAIHGHSVFHDPDGLKGVPRTWQLCDPQYLQKALCKPIFYDFRSYDVAHGGQGAPLVPIFHLALAYDLAKPVIFLNIGGVSNFTFISSEDPLDLLAGDMGPGNALVNDYVLEHFCTPYDRDGEIALSAEPDESVLQKWLNHPYFFKDFPKSLDRDTFHDFISDVAHLPYNKAVATLSELTVQAIIQFLPVQPKTMIVCGGGRHNKYFMGRLQKNLSCDVVDCDVLGLNGDGIEAQAFAFLGARSFFNLPISFPKTTGVSKPTSGGRFLNI